LGEGVEYKMTGDDKINGLENDRAISKIPSPFFYWLAFFLVIIFLLFMIFTAIYRNEKISDDRAEFYASLDSLNRSDCVRFVYEDDVFVYDQVLNSSQLWKKVMVMSRTNRTLLNANVSFRSVDCGLRGKMDAFVFNKSVTI